MIDLRFLFTTLGQRLCMTKGVICFEGSLLTWFFETQFPKYWIFIFIPIFALYVGIAFLVFERNFHSTFRKRRRYIQHIPRFIRTIFMTIVGAWGFLIFGATIGDKRNFEEKAKNGACLLINFRLGRGIFSLFYMAMGLIPILCWRRNLKKRELIAKVLALIVILWGIWTVPHEIMHLLSG